MRRHTIPFGHLFTTYNIDVDGFHTYFADNPAVWVHNRAARAAFGGIASVARLHGAGCSTPGAKVAY